ncbi:hypothetical protein GCM10027091_18290 [Streptomyces daliensis]
MFGPAWQTVYRRFAQWSRDPVRARLYRVVLDELGARGELDWSRCAIDSVSIRAGLRSRGIPHRIARKGIEPSQRLGRHRWVVERTVSRLGGCRRLHRHYERRPEHFLAFVGIATALICHRRLTT